MSAEVKMVLAAAALCVIGAVLTDAGVHITGVTVMALGVFGVVFGPVLVYLSKGG